MQRFFAPLAPLAPLAPSCKAEYAGWISTAKHAETRKNRAAKAVEMLTAGKKRLQ